MSSGYLYVISDPQTLQAVRPSHAYHETVHFIQMRLSQQNDSKISQERVLTTRRAANYYCLPPPPPLLAWL